MLQWITALEKAAATTPFVAKHRFDSFSPVRLNVAAQWLVDGVRVSFSPYYLTLTTRSSATTCGICPGLYLWRKRPSIFTTGGYPLVRLWLIMVVTLFM
jgi:hypothetical protein